MLRRPPAPRVPIPDISANDIESARGRGRGRRDRRRQIEQRLAQAGLVLSRRGNARSPVAKHRRLQRTSARARALGTKARTLEDTSQELRQRWVTHTYTPMHDATTSSCSFRLTAAQGTHALNVFSLVGTSVAVEDDDDACNDLDADASGPRSQRTARRCATVDRRFRTQDGSCNNRRNPAWGQASTSLQRILHPKYEDGKLLFRGDD